MQTKNRTDMGRKNIICVDSYEEGILRGRLYTPLREMETFSSLSQLLLKMDSLLDQQHHTPRSYTQPRVFSDLPPAAQPVWSRAPGRRGEKATFELQVLFRQHTSWQGILHWVGENVQQQFRSVLELVFLLDSAMRSQEEKQMLAYSGNFPGEEQRPPAV